MLHVGLDHYWSRAEVWWPHGNVKLGHSMLLVASSATAGPYAGTHNLHIPFKLRLRSRAQQRLLSIQAGMQGSHYNVVSCIQHTMRYQKCSSKM